jgi:hypothetical protein
MQTVVQAWRVAWQEPSASGHTLPRRAHSKACSSITGQVGAVPAIKLQARGSPQLLAATA